MTLTDLLPATPDPERRLRRLRRVVQAARAGAVPAPGGSAHRDRVGGERHLVHPHRVGQEPGRRGRPLRRAGRRQAHLLHRAHQGAGIGEVLRPVRRVRPGPGRHDDRGRQRESAGPDHLLHRGGAGQHRAAGRRRGRRRPGGDGRVPLLRRPRSRLGVAGASARTPPRAVRADVRDAGRRQQVRGGPDQAHRPTNRRHPLRRAPGAAGLLLRHRAAARDAEGAAQHGSGARLRGALHAGGRLGAGAGADEHQRLHPRGEGRHRRPDRRLPVRGRLRRRPCPGWCGTASASITPACCPSTAGWWRP